MQKIREHPIQEGTPLYVICENVVISEKDGLAKVEEHLNCTGHRIDSKNFSPCKRDRMYFTTVRPDFMPIIFRSSFLFQFIKPFLS